MKENRALSGGLCALGCEVLYGLSYLFTKRTADAASALALLGWRFIVALAVMSLCVALGLVKIRLKGRRLWPLLRVALFCPCLYFIGETVGIRETTVTESGVFLACVPALSLLASAVILKKEPTRRQVVGISITFLGVMTTVIAVGISSSLSPMGYAALMLAVAAYALYSVFVDLASDYTGAEITYAMLLSGAAFYGLLALGEAAAHGVLTALLDVLFAVGALLETCGFLFLATRLDVRLYALLGAACGVTLYRFGLQPALDAVVSFLQKQLSKFVQKHVFKEIFHFFCK